MQRTFRRVGRVEARMRHGPGRSAPAMPTMYTWLMPKQKRPFVVEIEAKLTVHAFE